MILRFLFYFFLFYLGYKLLFEFIIPLFKTTRQVKRGFKHMQDQMRQQAGPAQPPRQSTAATSATPPKNEKGDYIDFEEIK